LKKFGWLGNICPTTFVLLLDSELYFNLQNDLVKKIISLKLAKLFYMKHQFTLHHLISYIYGECSLLEKAAIEQALKDDAALANQLRLLIESQNSISELNVSPKLSTIDNILSYSKTNRFEKTH
jgi:hypothetical protein